MPSKPWRRRSYLGVIAACRDPGRLPANFAGEIRIGDLRDAAYRARLLDGVDVVCHCMSWTTLFGDDHRSRDLYLEPTLALLDAVVARGVKRFVNVSTTSAAAPDRSADPMSRGIPRSFWPHLSSVVAIENAMRERANARTCMVNLRFGIFAGRRYGLGVLPILVPRLKTHLVPWVAGGRTSLPITAGEDIGEAMALAATAPDLAGYEGFNVVGPEVPSVRQVIEFLHEEYALPLPHFSVPFAVAYPFAWLMEKIDPFVSWDPLVTRSVIHLLEEVAADNERASGAWVIGRRSLGATRSGSRWPRCGSPEKADAHEQGVAVRALTRTDPASMAVLPAWLLRQYGWSVDTSRKDAQMNISSSLAASYAARTAPIVGKLYASLAASGTLATPSAARIDAGPDAVVTLSAKAIQPGSARSRQQRADEHRRREHVHLLAGKRARSLQGRLGLCYRWHVVRRHPDPNDLRRGAGQHTLRCPHRPGDKHRTSDPGWRNPYADPGYDYAGAVADLMGKLKHEFLQGLLTTAQYQHDMSFYTRLADALNA